MASRQRKNKDNSQNLSDQRTPPQMESDNDPGSSSRKQGLITDDRDLKQSTIIEGGSSED